MLSRISPPVGAEHPRPPQFVLIVTGCQFQSKYSNNDDNPVTHRLSAVSNIAAAGPGGESEPYGPLPVYEVPTADGGLGSRACPDFPSTSTDVIPTSTPNSGTCGKPLANTDPEASEWMGPRGSTSTKAAPSSSGRYSDEVVTRGDLASGDTHPQGRRTTLRTPTPPPLTMHQPQSRLHIPQYRGSTLR
jgi:hypothetical protein